MTRNYNTAAQELSNAALKLAAAVEWAEKNVVFNKYYQLMKRKPMDPQIDKWDRMSRFVKLDENGRERNMTTHDLMRVIKNDFHDELIKSEIINFPNMDSESVR